MTNWDKSMPILDYLEIAPFELSKDDYLFDYSIFEGFIGGREQFANIKSIVDYKEIPMVIDIENPDINIEISNENMRTVLSKYISGIYTTDRYLYLNSEKQKNTIKTNDGFFILKTGKLDGSFLFEDQQ